MSPQKDLAFNPLALVPLDKCTAPIEVSLMTLNVHMSQINRCFQDLYV